MLDQLDDPRGLWLGDDGTLCVAEAGRPPVATPGVAAPATVLANTGALTCIDPTGARTRAAEHLPYVLYSASGESIGPTDVAMLDGALYLLTGEGYGELARKLLRITAGEAPAQVADFLAFAAEGKPVAYFSPASFAANPYAMIPDAAHDRFLVADGATGQVLAAGLDGDLRVYSPVEGHEVLTGIAWGRDGLPYVASFSQLPHPAGAGAILRVRADGSSEVVADGLDTPIDLAFDRAGRLYVLEFAAAGVGADPYRNRLGRLVRLDPQGNRWAAPQVLIEELPYPTALLLAPDDSLYLTVHGAYSAPGSGAVVRLHGVTSWAPPAPALFARLWPTLAD